MFEYIDFTTGIMIMAPALVWIMLSFMFLAITLCVIKIMLDVNEIKKHVTKRF